MYRLLTRVKKKYGYNSNHIKVEALITDNKQVGVSNEIVHIKKIVGKCRIRNKTQTIFF